MVDFVKDGMAGDAVKHPIYGDGVIEKILNEVDIDYPIKVNFPRVGIRRFTPNGLIQGEIIPTLCFANGNCEIDQGTPPEREPKPIQFNGDSVWAWVGNRFHGYKDKTKRLVIASDGNKYLTIQSGLDNMESTFVIEYKYAWEIPEGEE